MSDAWPTSWWTARRDDKRTLWRGVEAQHLASTMRLVDDLDEQRVLEELLENSKPALPGPGTGAMHPLLATPFRYRSPTPSRFRRSGDAGLWYGAERIETACTELAYWRHRFLIESDGLVDGSLLIELTFFEASVDGAMIDLSAPPWSAEAASWTDPVEYAACQRFADACRARGDIAWIRYASTRHVAGHCAAVLDPGALGMVEPFAPQTWIFKVARGQVLMEHYADRLSLALPT